MDVPRGRSAIDRLRGMFVSGGFVSSWRALENGDHEDTKARRGTRRNGFVS
jgi:hypothetical protein